MANKQAKKNEMHKSSSKTDDQIITDLIENRTRQMEALVKIMSSFDEASSLKPKSTNQRKTFKRKPKY
jgi:hypothetical protein